MKVEMAKRACIDKGDLRYALHPQLQHRYLETAFGTLSCRKRLLIVDCARISDTAVHNVERKGELLTQLFV